MKKEINKIYKKRYGEIKLFEKMSDILKNHYNVSFVEKTHAHYVSFLSKTIKKKVRREISDLWIIMYSKNRKIAKMTFLQAKFHKSKTNLPFKFTGEYFQHELLSKRPQIYNIGKKYSFPPNILSFTDNDAIGTFGTFYFDCNNKIDFAYSVASFIKSRNVGTENKQTSTPLILPSITDNSCLIKLNKLSSIDVIATHSIDCFTNSVLGLMIGAEIQQNNKVLSMIGGLLINSSAKNEIAVTNFLSYFDVNPNDLPEKDNVSNIMIIDVDSKND